MIKYKSIYNDCQIKRLVKVPMRCYCRPVINTTFRDNPFRVIQFIVLIVFTLHFIMYLNSVRFYETSLLRATAYINTNSCYTSVYCRVVHNKDDLFNKNKLVNSCASTRLVYCSWYNHEKCISVTKAIPQGWNQLRSISTVYRRSFFYKMSVNRAAVAPYSTWACASKRNKEDCFINTF